MKRKYPKQNRPGGGPQKEPDSDSKPKIASHKLEVWSVFCGGLAAGAGLFAGILHSSRPTLAILFVWLAGLMGLSSLCCFWASKERHPAIKPVWWLGFWIMTIGCAAWAMEGLELDSEVPQFSPVSVTKPTATPALPTPAPSPTPPERLPTVLKLTPKQVMDKIEGEYEWLREGKRKAFEGMSVDWTLRFFMADRRTRFREGEQMHVSFSDKDGPVLVYVSAPVPGNEHLPITERNDPFRVRGLIEQITPHGITLKKGATFEPVTQQPSPTPKTRRK